ncbi:uncharacterized protein BX664DRAFT_383464 [Halteromyces radiatus]|uniref:uncharacterized protein n=1 Tax=Halteromyces radiatus TaxID=101107 RepID=UPI00221F53A2|nr:uncharacterized protein BX664DRAFT_383464 [Halteromyces radiatus]KAI8097137.1 hypothetical protein BX664DRAFT_383464 [Halteromyces radiatus]
MSINNGPQNHLFPFTVNKEGPVDAQQYLSVVPSTQLTLDPITDAFPRYTTVVMGRLLEGLEITPPKTCEGYVWKLDKNDNDEDNNGYDEDYQDEQSHQPSSLHWTKTGTKVDKFILWKKDIAPSPHDPRLHALESWMTIADLIHQPIPINQ